MSFIFEIFEIIGLKITKGRANKNCSVTNGYQHLNDVLETLADVNNCVKS